MTRKKKKDQRRFVPVEQVFTVLLNESKTPYAEGLAQSIRRSLKQFEKSLDETFGKKRESASDGEAVSKIRPL